MLKRFATQILESVFAGSSLQIAGAFAGEGIDKHADYAAQLEESLEAEKFLASMVTIFVTTCGFVCGPQSYCLAHVLNTRIYTWLVHGGVLIGSFEPIGVSWFACPFCRDWAILNDCV